MNRQIKSLSLVALLVSASAVAAPVTWTDWGKGHLNTVKTKAGEAAVWTEGHQQKGANWVLDRAKGLFVVNTTNKGKATDSNRVRIAKVLGGTTGAASVLFALGYTGYKCVFPRLKAAAQRAKAMVSGEEAPVNVRVRGRRIARRR